MFAGFESCHLQMLHTSLKIERTSSLPLPFYYADTFYDLNSDWYGSVLMGTSLGKRKYQGCVHNLPSTVQKLRFPSCFNSQHIPQGPLIGKKYIVYQKHYILFDNWHLSFFYYSCWTPCFPCLMFEWRWRHGTFVLMCCVSSLLNQPCSTLHCWFVVSLLP